APGTHAESWGSAAGATRADRGAAGRHAPPPAPEARGPAGGGAAGGGGGGGGQAAPRGPGGAGRRARAPRAAARPAEPEPGRAVVPDPDQRGHVRAAVGTDGRDPVQLGTLEDGSDGGPRRGRSLSVAEALVDAGGRFGAHARRTPPTAATHRQPGRRCDSAGR